MLDKAEDPEKMIRLMIQEMEDTLVDLKSSCAGKMATRAEMAREKATLETKLERWDQRAHLAVEKKRDDLAKEALVEKKRTAEHLEFATADIEHYDKMINECRGNIAKLEEKLEEVTLKHKLLVQRGVHAAEKKRARVAMNQATGTQAVMRFDELENRIERMEADADLAGRAASNDLEREFDKLESNEEIENELAALKKSMGPKASKPAVKTPEKNNG
jgi:phage shock protein A